MRYKEKIVNLPPDMKVGSEVGVVGEGNDIFRITEIVYNGNKVQNVRLSCGWREPLAKIYLLRGRAHSEAMQDDSSWIDVRTGECDNCGHIFSDSYVCFTTKNKTICKECNKRDGKANPLVFTT